MAYSEFYIRPPKKIKGTIIIIRNNGGEHTDTASSKRTETPPDGNLWRMHIQYSLEVGMVMMQFSLTRAVLDKQKAFFTRLSLRPRDKNTGRNSQGNPQKREGNT